MKAPEPWPTAPPALPPTCIVGDGRLGVSRTGKPAGCHALDVLGAALGLFGLGGSIGCSRLLGSLARVHDEKTEGFSRESPISVFYFHLADDPAPMPTPWGFLAPPPRLFK